MATFTGGETIVNTVAVNGSFTSGGVAYTCPAGRYAKVNVLFAETEASFEFEFQGKEIGEVTNVKDGYEFLMLSGQTILNGGGVNKEIILNIREFNNPS